MTVQTFKIFMYSNPGSQNVVLRPALLSSPENLLEINSPSPPRAYRIRYSGRVGQQSVLYSALPVT